RRRGVCGIQVFFQPANRPLARPASDPDPLGKQADRQIQRLDDRLTQCANRTIRFDAAPQLCRGASQKRRLLAFVYRWNLYEPRRRLQPILTTGAPARMRTWFSFST